MKSAVGGTRVAYLLFLRYIEMLLTAVPKPA